MAMCLLHALTGEMTKPFNKEEEEASASLGVLNIDDISTMLS